MDSPNQLDFQKIGERFVWQYYTQMHKDPSQMHRFYVDESMYTRGGSELGKEEPVVGQNLIHEKIMSLGLQQVHTKIRQVDCHPTIANDTGKSIVIQVTGELSVAGQPMRPFVQTFVLAHESPRKYFIHNDIFRYQVYDEDYTSEPEGEESLVPEEQEIVAVDHPISREATPYGNQEEDVPLSDNNVQKISPLPVVANEVPSISWSDQQPQPQYEESPEGLLQPNGLPDDIVYNEEENYQNTNDITPEEVNPPKTMQDTSWASRLKINATNSGTSTRHTSNQSTNRPPATSVPPSQPQPLPQRETKPPRKQEVKPLDKKPTIVPSISATRTTPDSHQVFVGNLPNGTTEEDLKGVFNKFGTVIEVRINPKNFGFVVFDSEKPVQVIIQSRNNSTLMLHDRKLNIEEKRPSTQRGNYGSGSGGNFGGFNNSRKIQQSSAFSGRPVRVPSGSSSKPQKR